MSVVAPEKLSASARRRYETQVCGQFPWLSVSYKGGREQERKRNSFLEMFFFPLPELGDFWKFHQHGASLVPGFCPICPPKRRQCTLWAPRCSCCQNYWIQTKTFWSGSNSRWGLFGFVVNNKAEEIYHKPWGRFLPAYMFLISALCLIPCSVPGKIEKTWRGPSPWRVYNLRSICII